MNFIFDVETTGLPKKRGLAHYEDPKVFDSARLLSISWIIIHNDTPIEQSYYIVKPEDFKISKESIAIHGITKEHAMKEGVSMTTVLEVLNKSIERCKNIISHNIEFDVSIILSEFHRMGMKDAVETVKSKNKICTMKKGRELMGIKKFPKLAELYKHLYGEEITNAHDAQYDTLYCYKCFAKMFPREDDVFYFGEKEVRLTTEQKAIVYDDFNKNILVIACAGSGKSSTMLCRIKHLIDKGVADDEIIMMTFTRDAANDMKEKLYNIMGYVPDVKVGTIDSIARSYVSKDDSIKHVSEYSHHFLEYLKKRDDGFFKRFKYLFVDEFQDINDIQYQIIECFTKKGVKLFAVGDDAQNIYSFRGSSIEFILGFAKLFANVAIHKLSTNFRCSQDIVNIANASIDKNINQIPKTMVAGPQLRPRKKPCIRYFSYAKQQNNYVADLLKHYIIKEGILPHKIAVLSPTNHTLYPLEELLSVENVPHVFLDGKNDIRSRPKFGHVCLSTIHKSKGLEWDIVILANMSDDIIPKTKNIEEERRLFYVGVTRAKNVLHIVYSAAENAPYVTRYVAELDKSLYDFHMFRPKFVQGTSDIDTVAIERSVTKLVSILDGGDYIALKEKGILPKDIACTKNKIYNAYEYNDIVINQDIYSDFGIFVKLVVTKMLGTAFACSINNRYALQTLANVVLDGNEFITYKTYKHNFKRNIDIAVKHISNAGQACAMLEMGGQRKIASYHVDSVISILSQVHKNAKRYGLPASKIPIFNTRFLPDDFDIVIKNSHDIITKTSMKWSECLDELWNVSMCRRIVTEFRRRLLFKDISGKDFEKDYAAMFNDIEKCFLPCISNKPILNQELCHKGIYGDIDIQFGDTIIDIRTSVNEDPSVDLILQLMCYKVLYEANNPDAICINKIEIFNPLKGICYSYDVSTWDKGKELFTFLLDKVSKIEIT